MKSLEFKLIHTYAIRPLQPIEIPESVLNKFREHNNKLYLPFIDRINAEKGYVELIVSNDGKTIIQDNIKYPLHLADEIHEHLSK